MLLKWRCSVRCSEKTEWAAAKTMQSRIEWVEVIAAVPLSRKLILGTKWVAAKLKNQNTSRKTLYYVDMYWNM